MGSDSQSPAASEPSIGVRELSCVWVIQWVGRMTEAEAGLTERTFLLLNKENLQVLPV